MMMSVSSVDVIMLLIVSMVIGVLNLVFWLLFRVVGSRLSMSEVVVMRMGCR